MRKELDFSFYEKCLSVQDKDVEFKLGGIPSVSKRAIMKYPYYWYFLPYLDIFDLKPTDFDGHKLNNRIRQNGIFITCEWRKIDPEFINGFIGVYNLFHEKFFRLCPEILNPFTEVVKLLKHYKYNIN